VKNWNADFVVISITIDAQKLRYWFSVIWIGKINAWIWNLCFNTLFVCDFCFFFHTYFWWIRLFILVRCLFFFRFFCNIRLMFIIAYKVGLSQASSSLVKSRKQTDTKLDYSDVTVSACNLPDSYETSSFPLQNVWKVGGTRTFIERNSFHALFNIQFLSLLPLFSRFNYLSSKFMLSHR